MRWNVILPQLKEIIEFSQYSISEFREALHKKNWTETLPFYDQLFHYEGHDFTLTALCNMYDLMNGDSEYADVELLADTLRIHILYFVDELIANDQSEEVMVEEDVAA